MSNKFVIPKQAMLLSLSTSRTQKQAKMNNIVLSKI